MAVAYRASAVRDDVLRRLADPDGFPDGDMVWIDAEGCAWTDHAGVYSRHSEFLTRKFRYDGVRAPPPRGCADPRLRVHCDWHLRDPQVMHFVRVYCHLGEILLDDDDAFSMLFQKYEVCGCYLLTGALQSLLDAMEAKMDHAACLSVLNSLTGTTEEGGALFLCAARYAVDHAQDLVRRASPTSVQKLSEECWAVLLRCLGDPEANVSDADLLEDAFALCLKRTRNRETEARALMLGEGAASCGAMAALRPEAMTFASVMAFRERHPGTFDEGLYMSLLERVAAGAGGSAVRPREYVPRSSYPRTLAFPRIAKGARVVTTVVQDSYSIAFVAVPVPVRGTCEVPAFACSGRGVMTLVCSFNDTVSVIGGVDVGTTGCARQPLDCIEIKVINFERERLRRVVSVQGVERNIEFRMLKMMQVATLQNEGYLFDPDTFPCRRTPGAYALFKVTAKGGHA